MNCLRSVRIVDEQWNMRNGSVAHITIRGYGYAVGTVDGSEGAIQCWHRGKAHAGPGYDLISIIPAQTDSGWKVK